MIFDNWRAVITGVQTQTCRLVRPGEDWEREDNEDLSWPHRVVNAKGKILYMTSLKSYPVQPSYRHPAIIYNPDHPCYGIDIIQPGDNHYTYAKAGTWGYRGQGYHEAYIRFTDVRQGDVRHLSHKDVLAEGFNSKIDLLERWVSKHDTKMGFYCPDPAITGSLNVYKYFANRKEKWVTVDGDTLLAVINARPAEAYQAWVMSFSLVKE
jgi:hypothetical protein